MGHLVKRFAEVQDCNQVMSVCFLLSKFLPNSCISVTSCVSVDLLDRKPCCKLERTVLFLKCSIKFLTTMYYNSLQQVQVRDTGR